MNSMQGYRGTRDFLPKDWAVMKYIFDKWRKVSERFGYEEYEAPIIEPVKLFTDKSGEEIKDQLFWFKDKGERDVTLRAELTPQLARYVVMYGKKLKKPFKWFSIPRLFRYERPQKGRLREFFQYNADVIGSNIESTAEIIKLGINLLRNLGLTSNDFKIKINDRQLVNSLIEKYELPAKEFYQLLDKRYKLGDAEFFKELRKISNSKELEQVFRLKNIECLRYVSQIVNTDRLKRLFSLVNKNYIEFDLSIVRGLAYYTGIVFEAYDIKGELRAIFGGGEYDNLVSDFGGPATPCVGFAIGDTVLLELLKEKELIPNISKKGVFIATIGSVFNKATKIADSLRNKGVNVYVNTGSGKISKQLSLAQSLGYKKVLIVGERDVKEKRVTFKNMKTGKERRVELKITMINKAVSKTI